MCRDDTFFFTLRARSNFGKKFCIVSTYTELHVQAKKSPFWIFHWGHDVSLSLPGSVNVIAYLLCIGVRPRHNRRNSPEPHHKDIE